jgi:calcineurin-like phosphoesterase family protein
MRYFTSDLHFGHDKIIDYCERPFRDLAHMHEQLICRWNDTVRPEDEVFVLGDVALYFRRPELECILVELHGTKHLRKGNHDHRDTYKARGWASVEDYSVICFSNGWKVNLIHDPRRLHLHDPMANGLVLHGHHHGGKGKPPRQELCTFLDVGVDCDYADYRPISEAEIINIIRRR